MKLVDFFDILYEDFQGRVIVGDASQKQTIEYLKELVGPENFRLLSSAPRASQKPDIVALIGDHRVQFEVKGREEGMYGPISLFTLSANRGVRDARLDFIASIFEGRNVSFEKAIDSHRIKNPAVGYPGDQGTIKSGKVPASWKTDDPAKTSIFYTLVLDHLHTKGDDYLVVHNRGTNQHNIFWTGLGENVLKAPQMPHFARVVADTAGGANSARQAQGVASGNSLRFAIKVQFE